MLSNVLAILAAIQGVDPSFDLVCVGRDEQAQVNKPSAVTERAWHFRIDLVSRKYCIDDCRFIKDIKDVQPVRITFWDYSEPMSGDIYESSLYISRETGSLSGKFGFRYNTVLTSHWSGNCDKKPFSGFPAIPTKF